MAGAMSEIAAVSMEEDRRHPCVLHSDPPGVEPNAIGSGEPHFGGSNLPLELPQASRETERIVQSAVRGEPERAVADGGQERQSDKKEAHCGSAPDQLVCKLVAFLDGALCFCIEVRVA